MTKAYCFLVVLVLTLVVSCGDQPADEKATTIPKNITEGQLSTLKWLNAPKSFQLINSTLSVTVAEGTDFFNSPEDTNVVATAPLLFRKIEGDFVAKALVEPDFSSQWNAVSLMMHADSLNWIKLAFENSDATGPSIVSVVTRDRSDDANGVILKSEPRIWLAVARKGALYALHWSQNGEEYTMARLAKMPEADTVKIGVEFQSPVGKKAKHYLHYFNIEQRSVINLRNLNE